MCVAVQIPEYLRNYQTILPKTPNNHQCMYRYVCMYVCFLSLLRLLFFLYFVDLMCTFTFGFASILCYLAMYFITTAFLMHVYIQGHHCYDICCIHHPHTFTLCTCTCACMYIANTPTASHLCLASACSRPSAFSLTWASLLSTACRTASSAPSILQR